MLHPIKSSTVTALCAAFTLLHATQETLEATEKTTPTTNLQSPEIKNPWVPSGSVSLFRYDKYLANRVDRVISEQPSLWYELNLEWPHGFYVSWLEIHGTDDRDWSTGASDETQVTAGYTWKTGSYKFKLQGTVINIHPIERWLDNDRYAFEAFVSRTWKFEASGMHSVTPEIRLGWFADTQRVAKGTPIAMPAVHHRWDSPFGIKCVAIQSRVGFAWDGGFNKNDADGIFFQAETGLQWKIAKRATLTLPGIKTFVPVSNHINDGRQDNSNTFFAGFKIDF